MEGRPGKGARCEGASRHRPLGPWAAQDGEEFHFATLRSKDEVPYVLRLAQLATLNPGSPPDMYLPGGVDPGDKKQVQFSPNVVQLEVRLPERIPEILVNFNRYLVLDCLTCPFMTFQA